MRPTSGVIAIIGLSLTSIAAPAEIAEWRPDLIAKYESDGGQNVPNFRFDGPWGPHSAGGVCQMLTSNWLRIAPTIDIDIVKFPVAGAATEFDQWRACWKLWSVDGYRPWTCCNAKLRKVLAADSTAAVPQPAIKEKKTDQAPEQKSTFMVRFGASSDIYHVTSVSLR